MATYRRGHIKSRIHRIKPKKSILRKLWFWVIILLAIVVIAGIYFSVFYSGIQIKDIIISGNQKVATSDIESIVSNSVKNRILSVVGLEVSSNSIFLLNTDKLDEEMINKFPVIETVQISKKFPQTLIVKIAERTPDYIFCSGADKNKCYFMDDNGIIFEPLSLIPQNIPIVAPALGVEQVYMGKEAVDKNIMDLLSKVESNLKDNFQINIKEALITNYVRLNISTSENWYIYFDLSAGADINLQLTKLNLLLNGGISATTRKNLRYVDLRPRDRAIICDNSRCGG